MKIEKILNFVDLKKLFLLRKNYASKLKLKKLS